MATPCRFCNSPLRHTFVDLGMSPLANAYVDPGKLMAMEPFYPLHVFVCENCLLVQLPEFESPENIFSDYAYFSSYSASWLDHARRYAEATVRRFALDGSCRVVEIASNDGYLLKNFQAMGIPVLGVEPARNVARVAADAGIPTVTEFFGTAVAQRLAGEGQQADLIIANNVIAHVPALNDFVQGFKALLKPEGVLTIEFPHLLQLIRHNQFDTIYHEHYSYFSFTTLRSVLASHGLTIFDVEELSTHGGSLRVFARHDDDTTKDITANVAALQDKETRFGLDHIDTYADFNIRVSGIKRRLLEFLVTAKDQGKQIAAYGAPAKGNTLLNYCGIRTDFIDYTVDKSPHKQGLFLPGVHIPIHAPDMIFTTKPDYVLMLPWNLRHEIQEQLHDIRRWGGQFIVPIPELEVFS